MTQGNWPTVPQSPPLIANRYRKGHSLGAGGFGEVFFGEDLKFSPSRPVAIKIIHPYLLSDQQVRTEITNEANILSQFRHPNILRVLDFEISKDNAFIVTELADGGSLADKLRPDPGQSQVPIPQKDVLYFLEHIASALDEAHQQGIIHRDIKPANILLDKNGRPLLADFGFAMTISNSVSLKTLTSVFGTPQYTAPEVWEDKVGKSSDIYALGIVLYEMITGATPFTGSAPALMKQHLTDAVPLIKDHYPNLNYPSELDFILAKALAKKPGQRYKKATDLYEAFKSVVENQQSAAKKPVIPKQKSTKQTAGPGSPNYSQSGIPNNVIPKSKPTKSQQVKTLVERLEEFEIAKNWVRVIETGEEILKLNPKHKATSNKLGEAHFNNGLIFYGKKKWLEAARQFELSLKYKDSDWQCYKLLGICLFEFGENKLSLDNLSQAIVRNPDDGEVYYYHGKNSYNLWLRNQHKKDLNTAISDFDSAIQLLNKNPSLVTDAQFLLGRCYLNRNKGTDTTRARNCFDNAINSAPNVAEYYSWRGLTKPADSAITDYTVAIALEPNNQIYYYQRGNRYFSKGNYAKAIQDYTKAIELNNESDYYFSRGKAYQQSNSHALAINDFAKAISLEANDWRYYFFRGKSNCYLGFYKFATKDFYQAFRLNPDQPAAHYELYGIACFQVKDYRNALFNLTKACQLTPEEGEYFFWRGRIYKELKNKDMARQDFDQAINLGYQDAIGAKKSLSWF